MINILAHRGLWKCQEDQNSLAAFRHAFESGFGVELDVRDCRGALVVSHDPPSPEISCISFDDFVSVLMSTGHCDSFPVAVNVKSSGLQPLLFPHKARAYFERMFLFDLAVPDAIVYARAGYSVFTRQSEYERQPAFYGEASGVWLDEFSSSWITEGILEEHLKLGKALCIVSPELHGREHIERWKQYREMFRGSKDTGHRLFLCTDHPKEASLFFNEKN